MTAIVDGQELRNDLLDRLQLIEQWWPNSSQVKASAMNAREVLVHLAELRSALKEQFQVEETQGLLPEGCELTPRFASESERLLQQHDGLLDRLNAVIASIPLISENAQAWATAKAHFDDFRKQLELHERAEIDLLQAACGDNFGSVD